MQKKILWILILVFQIKISHSLILGGTEVPKDHIIVYLLIGHSNMAGAGITGTDGVTSPRIWNYQWFSNKQWVPAKETPGSQSNGLSGNGEGGPGMPFLKGMAAAYPQYHIGVISNASFSSTCRGKNTGSNSSGLPSDSNRYWKGAQIYNQIISIAGQIQKDVTFGGIICMLGTVEATRTNDTICSNFGKDIAQMAKDIRNDLNVPNLPFIIGEYENGATGSFSLTLPWPKLVDAGIKSVPTLLPFSATVNSVGIAMRDDHHYSTAAGEGEFAKRVIAVIQAKGYFPTATSLFGSRGKKLLEKKSQPLGYLRINTKSGLGSGNLVRVNGAVLFDSHEAF